MAKPTDKEYDEIMDRLKKRLDQIEVKQVEQKKDYFWPAIITGWIAAAITCGAVIIIFS